MTQQLSPMPEDWQRALAIAAHPDDIEYGAAAAIATWTDAGRDVGYLLVTRGEAGIDGVKQAEAAPLREREQRASAAAVGVSDVEFLDHPDGVIEECPRLRRDITRALRRYRPELVITLNHRDYWHFGAWNSADHRAVGRAVLDATADAGNRWIFPELAEEGLQAWGGTRWVAIAGSSAPTHAVGVPDALDRAADSLAAHSAYLAGLGDSRPPAEQARDFVARTTSEASERFGGKPAVAFELLPR